MRNVDGQRRCLKSAIRLGAAVALVAASAVQVRAGECPRKGTLGTSRVMTVDAAAYPRVGLQSFAQTLPLGDREVVLTFDDGPASPMDEKILAALEQQCVRATFFMIGKVASEMPDLVRKIAASGHTVASHTWSPRNLKNISPQSAAHEIDMGFAALEKVLNGAATTVPSTPFFRYPFYEMTQPTLDDLQKRGIVVFGSDLWASDWVLMTPRQQLKYLIDRLKTAKKGIILMHDTRAQTAAMLPAFLRYLRDNRYRVVHVVAAAPPGPANEQAEGAADTRPN